MAWNWNIEFIDIRADVDDDDDLSISIYDYTLAQLRTRLEDDCVRVNRTRRPVLPEHSGDVTRQTVRWFEIRLYPRRPNSWTLVRLRFRRNDLYLHAYQIDSSRWREFGRDGDVQLIDGSEFLGFRSSYSDVLRAANYKDGHRPTLGRQSLLTATKLLATPGTQGERVARSLLVMALMFCEAVRFIPIQNYLRRTFHGSSEAPEWFDDLVTNWGSLSGRALYYIRNPNEWRRRQLTLRFEGPDGLVRTVVVETVDELLEIIGMLQNNPDKILPFT